MIKHELEYELDNRVDSNSLNINIMIKGIINGTGRYSFIDNAVWLDNDFEEKLEKLGFEPTDVSEAIENRKREVSSIKPINQEMQIVKTAYLKLHPARSEELAEFLHSQEDVYPDEYGDSIHLTDLGGELLSNLRNEEFITQEQLEAIEKKGVSCLVFEW